MTGSPPYFISFSWWDVRLKRPRFKTGQPLQANPAVHAVQRLLANTTGALIDVGANVGFMSFYGIVIQRPVYAIEPISYNIAKLCEGLEANNNASNLFRLYHAVAGSTLQPNITITRPSDKIGKFDQSSLSSRNIQHRDLVEEVIPMLTIDSIIPETQDVGVVKIDVQGHEYGVLQGMKQILSRKQYFPKYVFYEQEENMIQQAGYKVGDCERFLESFGYECHQETKGDMLCSKESTRAVKT